MNSPSTWQAFASRVDRKLDQGGIKNSVDQLSIPLASSSTPFRSKSRKTAVARSQGLTNSDHGHQHLARYPPVDRQIRGGGSLAS